MNNKFDIISHTYITNKKTNRGHTACSY